MTTWTSGRWKEPEFRSATFPIIAPRRWPSRLLHFSSRADAGLEVARHALEVSSAKGAWDFAETVPIFRMSGQTLGIIGCGRIGSRVYGKLKSFGFKFLICDPYLSEERKQELGIEVVDMETVFRNADFISIHTPLTSETRHLVNERTLAMMKPTAYLVNTSRGPMVDAEALAVALRSGKLAGAGIDVFDVEPPRPDYPLFGLPNAILTPHLSGIRRTQGGASGS